MTTKSKNWMAVRSSLMMASSNFRRMAQPLQMVRANERDYSGTVIAINAKEHLLNVRGWTMRLRSFNLSDHCECRQLAKSQASVDDLRPGEMVTVRYINVEGVRIAIRVEQQPALLAGNIFSLDIQNRSLTLRQKAFNRELQLAEDCEIILHDGLPGRLADLEVGNRVTVTYEAPDNVLTARRIEQTSLKIGGTLTAIDPGVKSFKAKALSGTNRRAEGTAAEELGNQALVAVAQLRCLLHHRAGGERGIDGFRSHGGQRVGGRRVVFLQQALVGAGFGVLMASGAVVVERRLSGHARHGTNGGPASASAACATSCTTWAGRTGGRLAGRLA